VKQINVLIMGAAGRDFHNFNVFFRNNPLYRVRAFTATQIPFIAGRRYPPSLAGKLYPAGIPVFHEDELEGLLTKYRINEVVFAYSDVSHMEVMHRASRVLARGADFRLCGPDATMLKSIKPVISVCAVRTGCGKSQVTRYLCAIIREKGLKPVVVRHPMPYGDLALQSVERFTSFDDLSIYNCTIEEREEYEPLIREGGVVFSGVDYQRILKAAEGEGDIVIWDGGNNDFPFFLPDMEITITDPLRSGDETSYFPGEVNLRRAHIVLINKVNAATEQQVRELEYAVKTVNPTARVIRTKSQISVDGSGEIAGKTVLVIEDGPTVTHGKMASGAGLAAAKLFHAGSVVDPRPYAVGSISAVFRSHPHIGPVLPAMGYRPEQLTELTRTIESTPCEMVLSATPIDLNRIMTLSRPIKRVYYDIEEIEEAPLRKCVSKFLSGIRLEKPSPRNVFTKE
jgi:predicted GTPase